MHRCLLIVLGLLLVSIPLFALAAPLPPSATKPPVSAELKAEAEDFAIQLVFLANHVSEHYLRPITPGELLVAALRGVHEAARIPVPSTLAADVDRALAAHEILSLVKGTREGLGDCEALHGSAAHLVAAQAVARSLDPYSIVVTGEDLRRGNGVDQMHGVGVELEDNVGVGPIRIKKVLPGSPAQSAGLRPKDEITHIDDNPVKDTLSEIAVRLLDWGYLAKPGELEMPPGTSVPTSEVAVTYLRPGTTTARKITLERQEFRPETVLGVTRQDDNSWDFWCDRQGKIAQVRLASLGNGTAAEVRDAITALRAAGMRGLILDVRWCLGGYLREAVNVTALFLGEGNVATVRNRGEEDKPYPSTATNKFLDFPMIVLVNGETSGGGELIAAALQDHQRAEVAGQRTIGKASIQTMVPLPVSGAGLKLTTGTFVRPNGKNLHRFPESKLSDDWGVRPDARLELRVSPDLNRQLKEWWLQQTLRPGPSREVLPLDDPTGDPVRFAAVKALLKKTP
jgi:carboxyl-terminal processing protease